MSTSDYPFERVIDALDKKAAEGCYRKTNARRDIVKELGLKNGSRLITILETLTCSGRYERGRFLRKSPIASVESLQAEIDTLKANIGTLANQIDIKQSIIDGKEESIKALRKEVKEAGSSVREIVLKTPKKSKKMKGKFHKNFKKIVQLASMRKNIFLYGPTGSGKTFVASQVAEALELSFHFVSCTTGMSESVIGGRRLPVNSAKFEYIISEFVKCYEQGGVFLLDEIDACDPNVLLKINSALANTQMPVDNRPEKPYAQRHKDFVCIAAANTIGTGGDRQYSGRNKLDGSTLDRFNIGKVMIDYDRSVERELCPNQELLESLWAIRKGIDENRLERALSTRFIIDSYEMVESGWTLDEVLEAYFLGWREDEVHKVKSYLLTV